MKSISKILKSIGIGITVLAFAGQAFAVTLQAHMTGAQVTAISGTTLTVNFKGNSYAINTDNNSKIIRRFGAASSLSQISVGDKINISGMWTDNSKTTAIAKLIRDGSIQERNDTFSGTVSSLTSAGFALQSINRGQQTVTINSNTKIINRKGQVLAQSAIVANDKVRVDGLWDRTLKTITATTIKDQSQPVKTTKQ